jgi:predicted permease
MGFLRRLRNTLSGSGVDRTIDDEVRFHLEQRIDEYVREGMTPEEARRAASRRLGNVTRTREETRDADILPWLRDAGRDLRYGARQLRRNPAFALAAILTLAIGIGANAALFSVIDSLLLRRLPVPAPEDLVLFNWLEGRKTMRRGMDGIRTQDERSGRATSTSFSYPTFLRLREANRHLTELFAFYPLQQLNVVTAEGADIASGQYVSANYFRGLGVGAVLGRTLVADDDRPGAPPAATITFEYWDRKFGRDPAAIGRTVMVNRVVTTIVGVTPPGFAGALQVTESPDISLPFAVEPLMGAAGSDLRRPAFLWVRVMGRLAPGATREEAAAALNQVLQRSMLDEWQEATATKPGAASAPDTMRTLEDASTLRLEPGARGLMEERRNFTQPLAVLMGCAGLVLLTACSNVACLLVSRAAARRREIAVRLAIGAGRSRVVRQLLAESLVIAAAGSLAAVPLAVWGTNLLLVWRPWGGGGFVVDHALNWRVLAFCGAATVVATLVFGLAPAFRSTRTAPHLGERGTAAPAPLMKTLVVAQVAISLVLLIAAGLFGATLRNLQSVELGFDARNLLLFRIQPQLNGYEPPAIATLYARAVERIEALPGVRSATFSRHPLLSFSRRSSSLTIDGVDAAGAGAEVNIVGPRFFETMNIPLLLGRPLDERDGAAAPKVAVVNQAFAEKYLPGGGPIGHRFWFGEAKDGDAIEIVGMTRDAKYTDLRAPMAPTIYVPYRQDVPGQVNFEVRTAGDPLALAPAVRQALRDVDPSLPLFDLKSQVDQAQESVSRETTFARLSSAFGTIALLLAAIGLYGTISYGVGRRTAEIGVRMALGAQRTTIARMVLRDALAIAAIGAALGIPAAFAGARVARTVLDDVLFGVRPDNPATLAMAVGILAVTALAAGLVPARRASKVDPMVALRMGE